MMKRIFLALIIVSTFTACQDYLDVRPKGKFIPKTMQDFEELSSNPSFSSNGNGYLERLSDGIFLPDATVKQSLHTASGKTYTWGPVYYLETEADAGWNGNYNNIYNANIILQEVDGIPDGTPARKSIVKGTALCNRAFAYLNLVLLYAPYYNTATAATDLAVPMVTVPDLEAKPSRATVQEIYAMIEEDLLAALPLLPEEAKNIYRNSKATAYGLLARLYLNMGQYDKALINAKEALKSNSTLFDFNTLIFTNPLRPAMGIANKPLQTAHPEMLNYYSTSFNTILASTYISPDLLGTVHPKDLRLKFGWSTTDRTGAPVKEPYPQYINAELNYNLAVPEMMLIAAEGYARDNKVNEALGMLNDLRKKRFDSADYTDLQAANKDVALQLVINERRIELFGKGLRWFDMKRLDKDPQFAKTYIRANTGAEYKLEKGSANFVSQIPSNVMLLNPNILPNPR